MIVIILCVAPIVNLFFVASDLDMVKHLVETEKVSVDCVKTISTGNSSVLKVGDYPLSVACRYGNIEVIRYLLQKGKEIFGTFIYVPGASVNMVNSEGKTVLHTECAGHELGQDKFYNRGGKDYFKNDDVIFSHQITC